MEKCGSDALTNSRRVSQMHPDSNRSLSPAFRLHIFFSTLSVLNGTTQHGELFRSQSPQGGRCSKWCVIIKSSTFQRDHQTSAMVRVISFSVLIANQLTFPRVEKYRPKNLSDVTAQDHTITVLQRTLQSSNVQSATS